MIFPLGLQIILCQFVLEMNRAAEIRRILAQATKSAYEQGWNDAMKAFEQAASSHLSPSNQQMELPDMPPAPSPDVPTTAAGMVEMAIIAVPGLSGAEIARQLPAIHERTIRTALRRLKLKKRIVQRNKGWFFNHEQQVSGG